MTDLIIGAAANYRWETVTDCTYSFVVSMRRSGYTGRCVFIVTAPVESKTKRKYDEYGVELWTVKPKDSNDFPNIYRFRIIPEIIKASPNLRYVMAVDTKDIFFLSDPTKWLEKNLGEQKLLAVSAGCLNNDDSRNRDICIRMFGQESLDLIANRKLCAACMIGGLSKELSELSQAISDLCDRRLDSYIEHGHWCPDQVAYNLLLAREPWLSSVKVLDSQDVMCHYNSDSYELRKKYRG